MRRAILIFCLLTLALSAWAQPGERRWLEAAQRVGWWLRSLEDQDGRVPVDALSPGVYRDDLASGRAGHLVFWIAMHRASGDYEALAAARRQADGLLASLPKRLPLDTFPPESSFYYGLPGVAWALDQAARECGDAAYADAARACVRLLIDAARVDEAGERYWDARYDEMLFGNSGTALFLLYAATELDDPLALAAAKAQGDRLLRLAEREGDRARWPMRRDRPSLELPNFSHGAAGIGYFLATLSMATGDRRYLDGAQAAARHLEFIGRRDLGGFVVPYGFGQKEWEGRVDLGWAHGIAGTAKLFTRLHQILGDPKHDALLEDCALAILRSNAPYQPATGFGQRFDLDRRFGLAGAAEFLIDRSRQSGDASYLDVAEAIAIAIRDSASVQENVGIYWHAPRPAGAERAGEAARFTGWFTGAAGYGLLFLKLDAAQVGAPDPLLALDDPLGYFPTP
jgi:hypothetical protein